MERTAERLRRRMEYLDLGVGETAARCGLPMKTLSRFVTGQLRRGLPPDTLLRLCRVLDCTPNQAYGLDPMAGPDPVEPAGPHPREDARIAAALNALPPGELVTAGELLDALVRARARRGG